MLDAAKRVELEYVLDPTINWIKKRLTVPEMVAKID